MSDGQVQVVLDTGGRVRVEPAPPVAVEEPTDVHLAVAHVGICGSDVHVLHGRHPFVRPPVVTGHEVVARVVATGPDVGDLAPGDAVVVNPLVWCGTCDRCLAGVVNQCADAKVRGFKVPGLARGEVVVDRRYCHLVDDGLPTRLAVLAEPVAVAWHATGRAGDLDRVLVLGGGPIGLAVLLALRARGARHVTVTDFDPAKRALALRLGATAATAPADVPADLQVDTTFDCVATADTLATAGAATVPGGTVVVVGVPEGDLSLPLARLQRWEIDVRGTGLYVGADIDAALTLLARDGGHATALVTAEYPVAEAAAAFAATADPAHVKVLLTWPPL